MRFQAIIFDCDGTLVDSELIGNQVIVESVAELGLHLTLAEALHHFVGRKMADTIAIIEQMLDKPLPEQFLSELRHRMNEAFETRLQPFDGVHDLLQALKMPVCVASNGPHEKMQVSLGVTGLLPYFEGRIFSGYDCGSWKPEPGLFLHAAQSMGVAPEACAVVEDSLYGVQAGVAAGMSVFGFAPNGDTAQLAKAGAKVFTNMHELRMELLPADS